jgi:hypothetical protein
MIAMKTMIVSRNRRTAIDLPEKLLLYHYPDPGKRHPKGHRSGGAGLALNVSRQNRRFRTTLPGVTPDMIRCETEEAAGRGSSEVSVTVLE